MIYTDGANTFTWNSVVEYRDDHTPIVNALSQQYGDVFGGYNLTLSGSALNFDTAVINIDGQPCTVFTGVSSSTSLTCLVSSRLTLPPSNSFSMMVGNNPAIIHKAFLYVMRWSDIRTWGTDLPPVDGDYVNVPLGMTLLVDQSTPKLKGILVENGTIIFADESDMIVTAESITVVGGKFIAGTEAISYEHKLTFVMTGNYYGTQLPIFGNKCIICM